MERSSPYYRAHLVVAAIRVIEHKTGTPPDAEAVSEMLGYSVEEVQALINTLVRREVLREVQSGVVQRLFVADPAPMEDLARQRDSGRMEKEVEAYAAKQKERMDRLSVAAKGEKQRKKELFAALEAQLKERVGQKKD